MSIPQSLSLRQPEDCPDPDIALWNPPTAEDRQWWAAETFTLDPDVADTLDPFPGEPALPFPEWIAAHASYLRSLESEPFNWLAAKVDEIAELARFLRALSPDDFDAKHDLQEFWAAEGQGGGA